MSLLSEYAAQHGAPEQAFTNAGWSNAPYNGKAALKIETPGGIRHRLFTGGSKYVQKDYNPCWYLLDEALVITERTRQPLIITNGEASTVVGQYYDLPVTCVPGGEKTRYPEQLIEELKAKYKANIIYIAFDCDDTGRKAAAGLKQQLEHFGFYTFLIAFDKYEPKDAGYDLADWCKEYKPTDPFEIQKYDYVEPHEEEAEPAEIAQIGYTQTNETIQLIADNFPWLAYLEEHFGAVVPAGKEYRARGNGGMLIDPAGNKWNIQSKEEQDGKKVGGNVIHLVQLAMFGKDYNKDDKRQWGQALREAAKLAHIRLPDYKPTTSLKASGDVIAHSTEAYSVQGSFNHTDAGNAESFASLYGREVRFNRTAEKWMLWDGTRWVFDELGVIDRYATQTARAMLKAASDIDDDDKRKKAVMWALSTENLQRSKAMLTKAESLPGIATTAKVFDTQPFLAAVKNGTLNLETGQLQASEKEHYITKQFGTHFDPGAPCPRWLQFLNEVFAGDEEQIEYIQRAVGYSLTGDTREQVLFLLHGNGRNGKSVFLETIAMLMGDYAETSSFATFDAGSKSESTNDLAKLNGARFVTIIEADEDRRLNEAKVKSVTGQDTITCRFLHKEFFNYRPQFKVWLAMNHKPIIRGTDEGIWRRIQLIPFNQNFRDREDKMLAEKLRAELPGILNWALEGLRKWREDGLKQSRGMAEALDEYRSSNDTTQQWIEDQCEPSGEGPANEMYEFYKYWCSVRNIHAISFIGWCRRLNELGYETKRTKIKGKKTQFVIGLMISGEASLSRFGRK